LDASSSPASSNLESACLDNPANSVNVEPELPVFQKRDRVMTPKGEGKILYFNESWGEYNVAFEFSTHYFKPQELALIVPDKFNSVDDEEILEAF
jgi:hypothetical protein